jgi:DNA-binding MarR family transcriptional regulator
MTTLPNLSPSEPNTEPVGYAMEGATRVWPSGPSARSAADPLGTVIGPTRAALLRHLEQPATMGALAAALNCAPSTVTHHCDALEPARLIQRTRHGKTVWVSRTARGAELVDLLS